MNDKGFLYLSHSTIRGSLRKDLEMICANSCDKSIGSKICFCDVCQIMRSIKIEDSISIDNFLPEIRQSLCLNNYMSNSTNIQFNNETGFQGMYFSSIPSK
ncbi:hypothetical protein MHK_009724, partial [Candidatus Magnetomorum sp. HK-1]